MYTSGARLSVNDPQGRRIVPIDREVFTIGRRTAANLQVVSTDVSREHAEIAQDDGRYVLRDRGSRYGTFVNGDPVTEHILRNGDRIRLGRTDAVELVFLTEDGTSPGSGFYETTESLDLRQMAAILNGLSALGSGRVLEEVLTLVMDSALDVTKAERGFVMLANEAGELEFKTARGRNKVTLPGTSFTTSAKIPREVFRTGQSRIVPDLMDGDIAGAHEGTIAIGIRHVMCVPLRALAYAARDPEPKVIGVLYLDGRERGTMLSKTTLSSLEAFATQAGLAINSAQLYAEAAEKARIDRDLRVAAEIQRRLLPEPSYESPICALAAATIPCRTIGGDFFDYVDFGTGSVGFALGDVAGKGPPAALLAATVQSNFVAHSAVASDPADTMSRINRALLRRAIDARFATMFYGVLEPDGHLSYCNAGQEPPLVVRHGGIEWLETGGPVLGLLALAAYSFERVPLETGDLVIVCSDGVTEARNTAGDEFGRERLVDAMQGLHGARPEPALEALLAAVRLFSEGAAQADDITALVLRYQGPGASG